MIERDGTPRYFSRNRNLAVINGLWVSSFPFSNYSLFGICWIAFDSTFLIDRTTYFRLPVADGLLASDIVTVTGISSIESTSHTTLPLLPYCLRESDWSTAISAPLKHANAHLMVVIPNFYPSTTYRHRFSGCDRGGPPFGDGLSILAISYSARPKPG